MLGAQAWVEATNRAGGIWLHGSSAQLPLRLTSYDDASEPEQCAMLTERLITEDQVDILSVRTLAAWRSEPQRLRNAHSMCCGIMVALQKPSTHAALPG